MSSSWGLTDDGYVAPRAADFLATIRASYEADTGYTPDWGRDTFLGEITAVMAVQLGALGEASAALYDAFRDDNAQGAQLDDLAALTGTTRSGATYSRVTLTLTGTAGTIVTAGKLVEGGGADGRARWALADDATIGGGGTVDVVAVAEDVGAVVATAGEVDTIVTPVAGWTSVTNAADATPGDDLESDAALRLRRRESVAATGGRSLNALRGRLLALDGVEAAVVVDNDTTAATTVGGVALDPHSLGVVVYPSTLTDTQKAAVARTIYEQTPAGIKTMGAATATVTGGDGYAKTVRWGYASDLTVNVATVVVLDDGYVLADVTTPVQAAVTAYFTDLSVGDAARRLRLYEGLAEVPGIVGATVTFNGGGDVEPTLVQRCVLGTNAVTT